MPGFKNILHKLKRYFLSRRPATGLRVSGCCTTMHRHTKRPLYANIWNRKRLSSFRTLLIRQILPLVTRGSKNTSLEENIKRAKISVRLFFSVWTVYLEKIMKMYWKIGLKDWNFVYHMVASILKDWDKEFGIVCLLSAYELRYE